MAPRIHRFALPVIVLIAVAGYVVYWFQVAAGVPGWVALWADHARARGYQVEYGAVDTAGFPFRLEVTVDDVAFGHIDERGPWLWRGAFVRALLKPWDFERVFVTLPEEHRLEPAVGGALILRQGLNQTAIVIESGAPRVVAVDMRDLTIEDATGRTASIKELGARYELTETDDGQAQRTYGIKLVGVDPAVPPPVGFPAVIDEFALVARLVGELPEGDDRAALARWRDQGGVTEIDALRLRWGALDLGADGTLALDQDFRPLGAFTVRVAGYDAALETATGAELLPPAQAFAIGALLDAIAKDDGQGGRRAEIAVTIQDGQLFVGPLPVAKVPPLPVD